jgi:hypothetical protein
MTMASSKPPSNNISAMLERHIGCLPILGIVVVTLIASRLMDRLAQYLYVNVAYGHAAWHSGLRLVDNKGHLSNGAQLSGTGQFLVYAGGFLLTLAFFLGSAFGLPYLAMRRRGERLSDQLDRWQRESGGANH